MFDLYVVCEDGFKNVTENNEITGFELKLRIPYYRGVALSLVEDIKITVDGEEFTGDDLFFSVKSGTFQFKELETLVNNRWEFGEKAKVIVKKPGGLNNGAHTVTAKVVIRVSYHPWPNVGNDTKELILEA